MDCITAPGYKDPNGYGRAYVDGKSTTAHRAAWIHLYGPLPSDVFVLHACDNPGCINVEHLFLGSHADNMRDKAEKQRCRNQHTGKTHCVHGHPLEGDNLYVNPKTRQRCCRECAARRNSKWKESKR